MHKMKGQIGGLGQKSAQLNTMKIAAPAFNQAPAFGPAINQAPAIEASGIQAFPAVGDHGIGPSFQAFPDAGLSAPTVNGVQGLVAPYNSGIVAPSASGIGGIQAPGPSGLNGPVGIAAPS